MGDLPRRSVSVTGIVVRNDGRVLAIQWQDDGRWVPPGGVLELAETPAEGVAREVLEETGIKVQADRLTGVYKNMRLGVVTLAFRCSILDGQGQEGETDEAKRVAWLDDRGGRASDARSPSSPSRRPALAGTDSPRGARARWHAPAVTTFSRVKL